MVLKLLRALTPLCLVVAAPTYAAGPIELLFVGDVSFAGRRPPRAAYPSSAENPLRHFAARFAAADLAIANGEGLLVETPPASYAEARLDIGASPRWAHAYKDAGIDLVGLANNHSWDSGTGGVLENRRHLDATGVAVYGAGPTGDAATAPYRLRHGEACHVAIVPATLKSNRPPKGGAAVAFYPGGEGISRLTAQVSALVREGCFVIVSVHWGREGVPLPPSDVVRAGHALVDAGASVVVGHHPHVLQGVEFYQGGVIAYSLGNYVFVNRAIEKRRTGVLSLRIADVGGRPALDRIALIPALIHPSDFSPRPATTAETTALVKVLASGSQKFGTRVSQDGDLITFKAP
ncbi:MAG: CapA family protein [Myxococcales bacterium]|nr:CapA family protein [Myxococcales bacterium]